MTRDQLITCGAALYGRHWQTDLAEALGVTARTIRRWVAGDPIPPGAAAIIPIIMRDRADSLKMLAMSMIRQ